jgi:hypothetical protein
LTLETVYFADNPCDNSTLLCEIKRKVL